ncbi:MAG: hypothetical protein RI907_160 [Pseudomonadota bacterium]|jgi:hypothetical protein
MHTIRITALAMAISAPLAAQADVTPPPTPPVNTVAAPATASTVATKLAPGAKAVGGKTATLQTNATSNGDDRSQSIGTVVVPPRPPKKEALEAAKAAAKAGQH